VRGAKHLILPCFFARLGVRRAAREGARFPLVPLCPVRCGTVAFLVLVALTGVSEIRALAPSRARWGLWKDRLLEAGRMFPGIDEIGADFGSF
jgi:hypothetical protein